jgi:hypothetical protein
MADDVDVKQAPERESPAWIMLVIASMSAVTFLVAGNASNDHLVADHWEHAAAVRAFMDNFSHPHHPLFAVDAPHAFLSPYAWYWAHVAVFFHVDANNVFIAASIVNMLLFYTSLFFFVKTTCARPWATTAIAIPLTLFAWGEAVWVWSGFFHYPALVLTASYPSTFAASLVFIALVIARDLHSQARLVALTAVAALCWSVHPMTAVVLTASVGVVTLARRATIIDTATIAAALVCAFFLAAQWKYFPLLDLVTSSDNKEFDQASKRLYTHILLRSWPLLVCAAFTFWRLRVDRRDPIVALVVVCAAIFGLGFFSREGLGRAIAWVGVFAQIGAASFASTYVAKSGARLQPLFAIVFAIAMVAGIGLLYGPSTRSCLPNQPPSNTGADVLRGHLRGDVVLTDLVFDGPIPAMDGRVVAWKHPVYWVPDLEERREDNARFFARSTSPEERAKIIKRWNVHYIFIEKGRHMAGLFTELGHVVSEDPGFALIRVDPAIIEAKAR